MELGEAFVGRTGISSLAIPHSVNITGDAPVVYCQNLTSIEVACDNRQYRSENNCLLDKSGRRLICVCPGLSHVEIPNGVTVIGKEVFFGASLVNIEIPDSVSAIEDRVFFDCSHLSSIKIPRSVFRLGKLSFFGCTSLNSLEVPDIVIEIGLCAFKDCTGIISIDISDSVTTIGEAAFHGCKGVLELKVRGKDPTLMEAKLKSLERKSQISLYVPIGTGYAYRHNEFFKHFKEIIPLL